MKNIFVGNLSFQTTEEALREHFAQYGSVRSVAIIQDRATGRSRGFGFVEMDNDNEADAAISSLDGQALDDRNLNVNEARERSRGREHAGW